MIRILKKPWTAILWWLLSEECSIRSLASSQKSTLILKRSLSNHSISACPKLDTAPLMKDWPAFPSWFTTKTRSAQPCGASIITSLTATWSNRTSSIKPLKRQSLLSITLPRLISILTKASTAKSHPLKKSSDLSPRHLTTEQKMVMRLTPCAE